MGTALEAKARGLSETTLEAKPGAKKEPQQEASVVFRHDKALREKFVKKEYNATSRQFNSPQMQLEYDKIKIVPYEEKGFQASIPWKKDPPPFRNNLKPVLKRQQGTLRSLHRHGVNRDDVSKIFKDYEARKYIERTSEEHAGEVVAPKKMITNARSGIKDIPEADCAKEVSLINNELSLSAGKILGLVWDPGQDVFKLKGDPSPGGKTSKKKPKMKDGNIVWTLRSLFSTLFKVFDPKSFVGPYTIRGKHLQRLTMLKQGWNEEIPTKYLNQWLTWLQELDDIQLLGSTSMYKRPITKVLPLDFPPM